MRRLARGVAEVLPPPLTHRRRGLPYKEGDNKKYRRISSASEGGSRPRCYLLLDSGSFINAFACSVEGYCKAAAPGHEAIPGFVYKWTAVCSLECKRCTPPRFITNSQSQLSQHGQPVWAGHRQVGRDTSVIRPYRGAAMPLAEESEIQCYLELSFKQVADKVVIEFSDRTQTPSPFYMCLPNPDKFRHRDEVHFPSLGSPISSTLLRPMTATPTQTQSLNLVSFLRMHRTPPPSTLALLLLPESLPPPSRPYTLLLLLLIRLSHLPR